MNREDEFELRLAEWLEDGPFEAPDHVVNAAIEHARRHPRRRPLRIAFWRSAMSDFHAAPAAPRHLWQLHRSLSAVVAAVAVVAIVVGSGALLASMNRNNQVGPGPVATASPAPLPTPTPSPVTVTGTGYAWSRLSDGTVTPMPDGRVETRGQQFTSPGTASDARVAGESTVTLNIDENADGSALFWGTATLKGPDGDWTGPFAGLIEKGYTMHRMAAVMTGSGAYKGLQYRYTQTSPDGVNFTSAGVIESVPPFQPIAPFSGDLAITGTDTCTTSLSQPATQTIVGSVTQTRNASTTCTENTSDARTNGQSSGVVDMDIAADDTGTMWGTREITNSGGAWSGVFSCVVESTGSATVTFVYIGSGAYAGYRFVGTAISSGGSDTFTITGTVKAIS